MRSRIRQISKERLLHVDLTLPFSQEPKHPLGEIRGRVEPFIGNLGDFFVRDLLGAFDVERRQHLDGWSIVFQEWFVQVCSWWIRLGRVWFVSWWWLCGIDGGVGHLQWFPAPGSKPKTFWNPRA
jgi:hypothetical protein